MHIMVSSPLAVASAPSETSAFDCIQIGFEAQVERTPDAIALICPSEIGSAEVGSTETLSYQSLNQRANRLAHYLRNRGIGPDTLVAVCLPRSVEMIVAFLAVLKAGGAYVPIDPSYPPERQAYLLKDSQAPLVITESGLAETLPVPAEVLLCLDQQATDIAQFSDRNPTVVTTADNLAYMIYTSGSTGNPKGVLIPHRGMAHHSQAIVAAFEMTACVGEASEKQDRMLQFCSMGFDIIVEEIYPTLVSGGCLVLRTDAIAQSIKAFVEFVAQHQVTVLNLPTAFWHELVRGLDTYSLPSSVRLVIVGGEKISRAMYARWREVVGERVRWLNGYGPTEATVTATLFDPIAAKFDYSTDEIPIGYPLPHLTTHILDDNLRPVPAGTSGELYIGGSALARGYHNRPEKTAASFIANPFQPGTRLYKTGDLVRERADGAIEFIGRADFQVKIRGFRIELGEIESCLEQHPQVAQQIVVAKEDSNGNKQLVAYVVPKEMSADVNAAQDGAASLVTAKVLGTFIAQTLPQYMVPSAFVFLEALPVTTNGKVDRKSLPEPVYTSDTVVAPTTDLEAKLVELWQEILAMPTVGITDSFFELGGYSLLVARFFDRLEQTLGYRAPYTLLLESPTIQTLAQQLEKISPESVPQTPAQDIVVPLATGTQGLPLFLIHDADGDTSLYLNLAQRLNRPVYGLKPRLDDQDVPLHSRIVDMATDYRQTIKAVQPVGPYCIGGLCAGGVLAFEVALQLQSVGDPVEWVALLEAPDVQAVEKSRPALKQRLKARLEQMSWIERLVAAPKVISKTFSYLHYQITSTWQRRLTQSRTAQFRQNRDQHQPLPKGVRSLTVRDIYLFAEQDYCPKMAYDGKVLLVKATEGSGANQPYHEVFEDEFYGWQPRVTLPIQMVQVPGGHSTMLSAEHVDAVVAALNARMPEQQ